VHASVRSNLIHEYFISRDDFTLIRTFKVYVRPILECASCAWSPHHILKIQQVETVQRKFTKWLPGYASLCYKERLLRLDLDSLKMRRLRHDLLYTYTIILYVKLFTLANTLYSTRTRGHSYKLYFHNSSIDVRKYFSVNVSSLSGTICLQHQNNFLVFLYLNILLTRSI